MWSCSRRGRAKSPGVQVFFFLVQAHRTNTESPNGTEGGGRGGQREMERCRQKEIGGVISRYAGGCSGRGELGLPGGCGGRKESRWARAANDSQGRGAGEWERVWGIQLAGN